jgi:LCP family protein required for cell wall assembly
MATFRLGRSRALRITVAIVAAFSVAVVGVLAYVYLHLNSNIRTYSSVGIATSRPPVSTPAPSSTTGPPINLLLIGSDSRSGGNIALGGGDGVDGARSDTTIVLHVSGDRKHATGVSIPRDALVNVPSCYSNGAWLPAQTDVMFNSAFAEGDLPGGNPICTQNTVEAMTGIRIDHTIVFSGFAAMSSAVGGVSVCVPTVDNSALEQAYGITLNPGMQTLSGQAALEYVRAREGFGDNSDIGRMKRQQAFLSALIKKMLDSGSLSDPISLYKLADAATSAITVDSSLDSVGALVSLAQEIKSVPLENIDFVTTPWQYDGARIDLFQPDTDVLWSLLREDKTLEGQDASGASASASASASGVSPSASQASGVPSAAGDQLTTTGIGPSPSPSLSPTSSPSTSAPGSTSPPASIPSGITDNIRKADSNPCSDLNYGN